jgi:UDP-N-acetylglucosamine 2-epimerase (non-hydrolysing)
MTTTTAEQWYRRAREAFEEFRFDPSKVEQLEAAIAAYRQVLALDPRDTETRYGLAEALRAQGNLEAAAEEYLRILESQPRGPQRLLAEVADYDVFGVSAKVVRIIHSYVDYVRRVVWRAQA